MAGLSSDYGWLAMAPLQLFSRLFYGLCSVCTQWLAAHLSRLLASACWPLASVWLLAGLSCVYFSVAIQLA
jgi:hypothetical protein